MRFVLLVDCHRISIYCAILLLESLWTESREAEFVMLHFIRERQQHVASPDSKAMAFVVCESRVHFDYVIMSLYDGHAVDAHAALDI